MSDDLLPVLTDYGSTLFPEMRCAVVVVVAREHEALRAAFRRRDRKVGIFARRGSSDDLYDLGVLAEVERFQPHVSSGGPWIALLHGLARVRASAWEPHTGGLRVRCAALTDPDEPATQLRALAAAVARAARQHYERFPASAHTRKIIDRLERGVEPSRYPGAVGDLLLHLSVGERQQLLETSPLSARLKATLAVLRARLPSHGGAFA